MMDALDKELSELRTQMRPITHRSGVMPAGELNARDGRRRRLSDADAVVNATRAAAGGLD